MQEPQNLQSAKGNSMRDDPQTGLKDVSPFGIQTKMS